MTLFERILAARGLSAKSKAAFLNPKYELTHDPFLLNDMDKAVDRLVEAHKKQDKIVIYGDYDIDGLSATTLLFDAFGSFGFKNVEIFIPNRFEEGYGLTTEAIDRFARDKVKLIVTVDCGSTSEKEIIHANKLGLDVIVTDHHDCMSKHVPAVAVVNPKYDGNKYPFVDLAGVGVAFKLVCALQTKLKGIPKGHEKWLLDLVALGTVCDVVQLVDENRTFVYFGMKVLAKTKKQGLRALMAVAAVDPEKIDSRSLGYRLGPRMNAAGRLETAKHTMDMLTSDDPMVALEKAEYLDDLNKSRRIEQDKIFKDALVQAERYADDPVLVLSGVDWNHGVVGIVASKILEKYKKPTFVLQEIGDESKGSARSFGDFSVIEAVNSAKHLINKGGGHKMAAGVTLPTKNIKKFRKQVNDFYKSLNLTNQSQLLLPKTDATADLGEITEELVQQISRLEPFGMGNPQPIIECDNLEVRKIQKMGPDCQHVKLDLGDKSGETMQFISFNAPESCFVDVGSLVNIWFHPNINEWRGRCSVEGQILHIVQKV
ncbi:MAG: single-stranded-DNA-specific exonuclease RecJ [Candidatus Saccharibacteria bacterium]|nr:single-stranded-DNA-specific exonuclease RecJ [Candidatus Saccharibacteria bacterium]